MEIEPHPSRIARTLGLFHLTLHNAAEQALIHNALDGESPPLLRDQWLYDQLGAVAVRHPMTVRVWRGQLRRIAKGLDGLEDIALNASIHPVTLADKIRPYTIKNSR